MTEPFRDSHGDPKSPDARDGKALADIDDPGARDLWRRVFEAADRAIDLEPSERREFLDRFRAEHPLLGDELAALIEAASRASALESPASAFAAPLFAGSRVTDGSDSQPPSTFGPYRVLGQLGRGGMGAVYLAERADDQYQKKVALKVFPPWQGGDQRRLQRFIEERQILAALDHPNIARLLDGGVTQDGLPWFAMELVEGVPIDQYCVERRLTIDARLDLFCRVCAAVQYAHRNLVVHRDLKPSNILVASDGRVVLLDFGIAKLLEGHSASTAHELTSTADRLLTPLYSSPEQIRGEPVSTASDVYALGVLLHVLLTGTHPYRLSTLQSYEVARAVLEQEAERPSLTVARAQSTVATTPDLDGAESNRAAPARLVRRLRGDLDAIVAKTLHKDPARRYATVEQLEADVRRHLAGLPVIARPESRLYHARKFVQRHRAGVAITAAVAVLVLAFTTVTTIQGSRIRAQAERITLERGRSEDVAKYLISLFQPASLRAVKAVTAREILDTAAARIDRDLKNQPEQRARLMFEMAQAYQAANLYDRAGDLAERSIAIHRTLNPEGDIELAERLNLLGAALFETRRLPAAERAYRESLALRRRFLGARHRDVARTLVGLASVLRMEGRLREAELLSREALAIDQARGGDNRADVAQSTSGLARVLVAKGDRRDAPLLFRKSLALVREKYPEEHIAVATAVFDLASSLKIAGDPEADSLIRYGLELYHRVAAAAALTGTAGSGSSAAPEVVPKPEEATAPVQRSLLESPAPATPASTGAAVDNSRIVFSSDRDGPDPGGNLGKVEIYIMRPDGTDQRRLTNDDALDNVPVLSPDGRRIAYASASGGVVNVFVMNVDGTAKRRVTNLMDSTLGAIRPSWSPDGRRIAFQTFVRPDIYIVNLDGTGLTKVTDHPTADMSPAWSPDGKRIAFASLRDGKAEIYVMDADGKNPVRLTNNRAKDQNPAWSPDNRRIVFETDRDGNDEIYVMNADGSDPVRLTSNADEDGRPSWSPDGRRIAFHRRVLGHGQVHVMNADGSDVRRLTELSPVAYSGFAHWGPPAR